MILRLAIFGVYIGDKGYNYNESFFLPPHIKIKNSELLLGP